MLEIGLGLPVMDHQGMQNVLNSLTDRDTSAVTNQFIHCSPFANDIEEGVNKLFVRLHPLDGSKVGISYYETDRLTFPIREWLSHKLASVSLPKEHMGRRML